MLSLRAIVGVAVLRIFLFLLLSLAVKGTEVSMCKNLVEVHDIIGESGASNQTFYALLVDGCLEDHVGLVRCHYNGANMTIAWNESKEIDGLQIEYQCFNESLENASQLSQVCQQILPRVLLVL